MTTTYDVPRIFWEDHEARGLADDVTVVKVLARKVRVELTDEAFADLASDARYYSTEFKRDPDYMGLASSAAATVRALDEATNKPPTIGATK